MKGVNGTKLPAWQLPATVIVALALVVSGGAIILSGPDFGLGFVVWLGSAIAIAVALYLRLRSGRRIHDGQAARDFRKLTLLSVLVGFSAVVNGILSVQANELVWALASVAQLVGAVAIGVYAVVGSQRSATGR